MKYTDDVFKKAYLSQLGLIKEDVDAEVASVETEDKPKKQITFITTDDQLVNTLGNEFETITITTKNPETEETEDITFTKDSFGNFEITDVVETDPAETDAAEIEECGDVVEEDEDEEDVEVVEEDEEDVEVVEEDEEDVEEDVEEDDKEETAEDEDDKDVAVECKSKHKINSPY